MNQATNQAILNLLANMSSTQIDEMKKQLDVEAKKKKTQEAKFEKVLAEIKGLGDYDKQAFTTLLDQGGFIVMPKPAEKKIELVTVQMPRGVNAKRDSFLRIFKGDNPNTYERVKKGYWAQIKSNGLEALLEQLTDDGKKFYATEEGKKEIQSWFH